MSNRLEEIHVGDHVIAIYTNQESEFDEALDFLKKGLDNDEIIIIITDRMLKDQIHKKMKKKWNVEVEPLESRDIIHIKTTKEWYYSHGFPNTTKIKALWLAMAEIARVAGKKGVRVFADTHYFFEKGDAVHLVNYESTLDSKFDFPFTAICAYDSKDIQSLTPYQRETLVSHHKIIWK